MITLEVKTDQRTGMLMRRVQFDNGSIVRVYGDIDLQAVQMESLGEYSLQVLKARVKAGLGADDAPMPPLSQRYQRQKSRLGGAPVRNLTLTGQMLDSLTVRSVSSGQVRMDITSQSARVKASANSAHADWYGWSPADLEKINAYSDALFQQNVDRAMKLLEVPQQGIPVPITTSQYPAQLASARLAA